MKLHLGAGTIYLEGYINIDVNPDYLIDDAPQDVLKKNTTTFENYYKHKFKESSNLCIVDIKSPITSLPFPDETIDEAVLIQVLEHIPKYGVNEVLKEIGRVLKIGGFLTVGVPDIKGLAEMLVSAKTTDDEDWCIRLIHGTQKNPWSHHYCGYTKRILIETLSPWFHRFEELQNISFYPSVYMKAFKEK